MVALALAVPAVLVAGCDGAAPVATTIPVVRLVGAEIETGPSLYVAPQARWVEVGRQEVTCGPGTDCLAGITVNPTQSVRVTFSADVTLGGEGVPAGTDVYPLLTAEEALPFAALTPFALRDGRLPARLDVPDGAEVTAVWTTTEGETLTATAPLER